ncbi:hypothetical protein N7528_008988 [Penicillium herquei]|nr:hypothetical protein N7528_008988 [Penicillium herquei]
MSTTQTQTVSPSAMINNSGFELPKDCGDWRDQLSSHSYAVVKSAIPIEAAQKYKKKALDWIRSFDSRLDLDDTATWPMANLPIQTDKNTRELWRRT